MTQPTPNATPNPGFRRLAVGAVVATLALIALGGAVRATDSGLACPTWPGCFSAGDFVPPADLNVWLEHSHRLVAIGVGLLIAWLTLWVLLRFRHRRDLLWPTLAAAVSVNVQAVLGAFVVWRWLEAWLVTAHLTLALLILATMIAVAVNASHPRPTRAVSRTLDLGPGRAASAVATFALLQIAVGGQVTGVGAGLAYRLSGFPLMDGALFPSLVEATSRELYHATHRALGFVLLLAVAWLWWRAARDRAQRRDAGSWEGRHEWLVRLPALATGLVAAQIGIGVANIATELSWLSVIPHLTVASWIYAVLFLQTMLAYRWAGPDRARTGRTAPDPAAVAGADPEAFR